MGFAAAPFRAAGTRTSPFLYLSTCVSRGGFSKRGWGQLDPRSGSRGRIGAGPLPCQTRWFPAKLLQGRWGARAGDQRLCPGNGRRPRTELAEGRTPDVARGPFSCPRGGARRPRRKWGPCLATSWKSRCSQTRKHGVQSRHNADFSHTEQREHFMSRGGEGVPADGTPQREGPGGLAREDCKAGRLRGAGTERDRAPASHLVCEDGSEAPGPGDWAGSLPPWDARAGAPGRPGKGAGPTWRETRRISAPNRVFSSLLGCPPAALSWALFSPASYCCV